MNENEFRDALRRVRPVEIDDALIATVVRQARLRRRRRWLAIVSAVVMLAVAVGAGVVWNVTREDPVAVPDPRGGSVAPQPTQTGPAPTESAPPPTSQQSYTGDLSRLPASYGTPGQTLPAGQGWTEQAVGIFVCVGADGQPNQVTSLRALVSAQTKANGNTFQSVLRFATPQGANAFVGELQRIRTQCEVRFPTSSAAGAEALTRPLPTQAQGAVDDGMIVGYSSIVLSTDPTATGTGGPVSETVTGRDGAFYQVGRRGDVVAVSGSLKSAGLAGTADPATDETHARVLAAIVASVPSVANLPYAGDLSVLPARYQTSPARLPHEGVTASGELGAWGPESVPLAICPTDPARGNTFLSLNGVTGARTLVQRGPERMQFEAVLGFADAEKASRFVLELASTTTGCGDRAATADVPGFRTGKRDLPAAVASVADEGFVIGYQGTALVNGQQEGGVDGMAYYVARKGSLVVVVGAGATGADAFQASSLDSERSQTMLAVLR